MSSDLGNKQSHLELVILGAGRVGSALAARSPEPVQLLPFRSDWGDLGSEAGSPLLVVTRNDHLDEVIARVPPARHEDLVLVQNGMLEPWLQRHGLAACTRGLLFFAVASKGAPIEPGGVSPFTGPHAEAVVSWFRRMELPAEVLPRDRFGQSMLEKLIWNCTLGLLGEAYEQDVGGVLERRSAELTATVTELAEVGRVALGIELAIEPLVERIVAYSTAVASFRPTVKEWSWRNGWFLDASRAHGVPTPTHDEHLRMLGRLPDPT